MGRSEMKGHPCRLVKLGEVFTARVKLNIQNHLLALSNRTNKTARRCCQSTCGRNNAINMS